MCGSPPLPLTPSFTNDVTAAIDWLFSNRHATSFTITHGLDPYILTTDAAAAALLSPSPATYLTTATLADLSPLLLPLFTHPSLQKSLNVITLTPTMLPDVLARTLPADWLNADTDTDSGAPSASLSDPNSPPLAYFTHLWSYICANPDVLPLIASQHPIIPTHASSVTPLSRTSAVISPTLLPVPIITTLTDLGCKTLHPALLTTPFPPNLFDYVFEPTAEGAIHCLDKALQRDASLTSPWTAITPEQRTTLLDYLTSSPKPLSDAALKLLRTFPIFNHYSPDQPPSHKPLSPTATTYALTTVPKAGDTSLLESLASHPSHPKSVLCFATPPPLEALKALSVTLLSRPQYYTTLVLPALPALDFPILSTVIVMLLTELPTVLQEEPALKTRIQQTACIPTRDGSLHTPLELFDPSNEQLRCLLDEDVFPHECLQEETLLNRLRELGLRCTMTWEAVITCARRIDKQADDLDATTGDSYSRARELLSFLDKNCGEFFPELYPKPSQSRSFFNKLTTALFDDPAAKAKQQRLQAERIATLTSLKWVPVCTTRPPTHPFLPWPALAQSHTTTPAQSKLDTNQWLTSSVYRLVASPVSSTELKTVLGWTSPPLPNDVARQLHNMATAFPAQSADVESLESLGLLCQTISSEIPRIYHILNQIAASETLEKIKATLIDTPWLWMGDSFVHPNNAAFTSPINATPYLVTVPPDLACFSNLLKSFGVRRVFGTSDFAMVLQRLSKLPSAERSHATTELAVSICQLISDDSLRLPDLDDIYAPTASGDLVPASTLVYDDAPWLSKQTTSKHTFVHPKISSDVGEKIGVKSLRRQLVDTNSEQLDFGGIPSSQAEAFGQAESLTRRLRNIIEMYPEGPSILSELIQNADDSGATSVKVLVSRKSRPTSSLLGPKMQAWQGPCIYVYNDSTFSDRDFQNLSRIGQASKLDKLITTGRFGLGFNAVFHWTDVPSFVSGDYLVMFDPHEKYVPGATSTSRGIKIKYSDTALIEQFPDQFDPYCKFGCDMKSRFNGTLFRFPLRDAVTARESEISKSTWGDAELDEMLDKIKEVLPRFLLFLRNVKKIEIFSESAESDSQPSLLYTASVTDRSPLKNLNLLGQPIAPASSSDWRAIPHFITGSPTSPLSKEAFYTKLLQTPEAMLPSTQHLTAVSFTSPTSSTDDVYLVCVALGGGRCREMAANESYRHMKFIPWGGVAAHISRNGQPAAPMQSGSAFCFLPLPVSTGMPVHVNGYFELSANRRDIWFGSDMTGEGRVRSEWNELLLADVIAPLYAVLLLQARHIVSKEAYTSLFPIQLPQNAPTYSTALWTLATKSLYSKDSIMNMPLFWCDSLAWVRPRESVIIDDDSLNALAVILLKEKLSIVRLPATLTAMLTANECPFHQVTPSYVREYYKEVKKHAALSQRSDALTLLKYCASNLAAGSDYRDLVDLPLLPLSNGSLGTIRSADMSPFKYTVSSGELELLDGARSEIVDTCTEDESINVMLLSNEFHTHTNVHRLDRTQFLQLLQFVFPRDWESLAEVAWDGVAQISEEWVLKFWCYLSKESKGGEEGASQERIVASVMHFDGTFPLLPCRSAANKRTLMTLSTDLAVILPSAKMPAGVASVIQQIGVNIVDAALFGKDSSTLSSALETCKHVQPASAVGCVRAISNLFPDGIGNGDLARRIHMRFRDIGPDSRDALRCFIRDALLSEGVETMGEDDKRFLKALPIFPTYDNSDTFLDLLIDERWIAPENANASLLSGSFVKVGDRRDLALLESLDVERMDGKVFWAQHGVPTMMKGSTDLRNAGGSQLLREMPRLTASGDNEQFLDLLRTTP